MKLRFGGELAAEPFRIGGSFGVADVDGPVFGQANVAEHGPVHPEIAFAAPERGMVDAFALFPVPSLVAPERAMLIAADFDEALKIAISDVDVVDGEAFDALLMRAILVVPAEFIAAGTIEAERGVARLDFNQLGANGGRLPNRLPRAGNFAVNGEAMNHIGEGLGVHETVLDGDFEHGGQLGMTLGWMSERFVDGGIQLAANAGYIAVDFIAPRPIGGSVLGETAVNGIDAEGEESIEGALKRREAKRAVAEQVPVESFNVAEIKNDAMAFGNGAIVNRLFANDLEQLIRARASLLQAGLQGVTGTCWTRYNGHGCFDSSLDAGIGRRIRLFGEGKELLESCSLPPALMSTTLDAKTPPADAQATIGFRQVRYRIDATTGKLHGKNGRRRGNSRLILDDISLSVRSGETVVLLGRSGSGKTTLLRLVNRMLLPSSGEVMVEGRATAEWDPIQLRRRIGYVIQEAGLFPHFTVGENIALVPGLLEWRDERTAARVDEMLHLVGLAPEEFRERKPRELSGGQRQRVGVARALAADPPILLMDEPFGALDPVTRAELQREFCRLAHGLGKTIVFVTHDLQEAMQLASRIVLLQAGRVVADAGPRDFLRIEHPEVQSFVASLRAEPGV